jgi:hypothetical protein
MFVFGNARAYQSAAPTDLTFKYWASKKKCVKGKHSSLFPRSLGNSLKCTARNVIKTIFLVTE